MAVMQIEYYSSLEDGGASPVLYPDGRAWKIQRGYRYSSSLSLTRDEWEPPLLVEAD